MFCQPSTFSKCSAKVRCTKRSSLWMSVINGRGFSSDGDFAAYKARQQKVASGAELLVLLHQVRNLAEHWRNRLFEESNHLLDGNCKWNPLKRIHDDRIENGPAGVLLEMFN